jgi:hypothetical protein
MEGSEEVAKLKELKPLALSAIKALDALVISERTSATFKHNEEEYTLTLIHKDKKVFRVSKGDVKLGLFIVKPDASVLFKLPVGKKAIEIVKGVEMTDDDMNEYFPPEAYTGPQNGGYRKKSGRRSTRRRSTKRRTTRRRRTHK